MLDIEMLRVLTDTTFDDFPIVSIEKFAKGAVGEYDQLKTEFTRLEKIVSGDITNHMKATCIGEFAVSYTKECAECIDIGADEDCLDCNGEIMYTVKSYVPWDMMKDIYKMMLKARLEDNE